MTIAACYVTPEGVVLGADSTASLIGDGGAFHFYNHNQKLFQIGEDSTLGILTWNLGGLPNTSFRTLIAQFSDSLKSQPAKTVRDAAERWRDHFWNAYNTELKQVIDHCKALDQKAPFVQGAPVADPNARTQEEETQLLNLQHSFLSGFCIGGYVPADRKPQAFAMTFAPISGPSDFFQVEQYAFWGAPNMIKRLIFGVDERVKDTLIRSGKWNGSEPELESLLNSFQLGHNVLPIRDAVDFVHACIYSTIKALKFSNLTQICGGPIELAVVTTDRKFRWVWHKNWDTAITEGDPR